MFLFLSPHLDDIALSCGGYVKRLTTQGSKALIATFCTANAPAPGSLSAAAQRVHKEWQLGDQPYPARREEDRQACALLGAQPIHLNLTDAIYRFDDAGRPLYTDEFIGVPPNPYDQKTQLPALKAALQNTLAAHKGAIVVSPMAVGGHVDHTLVRRAAEAVVPAARLRYYEDYPYAGWTSARMKPAYTLSRQSAGLRSWRARLTPAEVDARVDAVACYASQMTALFGSAQAMPLTMRDYISGVNGERYYRPEHAG
jgi:LmbE family N-acetylglucosaminyl deacetylase